MRLMRLAIALALCGAAIFGVAGPANAGTRNGVCEPEEFCQWYGPNFYGSMVDTLSSEFNYNTVPFLTPGPGQGQPVGNNSASAWCREISGFFACYIYTGPGWTGVPAIIYPGQYGNYTAFFRNNVESHLLAQFQ